MTTSLSRTMGLALMILAAARLAPGQGVPLPPIAERPPAAPATLPQPRVDDKPPGTLPPPKSYRKATPEGPLRAPQLGQPVPPGTPIGEQKGQTQLGLDRVLASVDRHYPLVLAAEQERVIAEGNRLAALGAFDVKMRSREIWNGTTYDNQRYSLGFEAQTPFQGISYFGGWRLGSGEFPIYYFDRKTGTGGEFGGGMTLPLLRDRTIDPFRAAAAKASIDQAIAEPVIHLQRMDIARAASFAYWLWVTTGQRYLIARDILDVARRRDQQLAARVKAGNLAPIEQADNRRLIIDREARLVAAQRLFQQASILLSLYLRDEAGCPVIPDPSWLPGFFEPEPPPGVEQRQKELEAAMERRPEVRRLVLQREKVQVDLDLAQNQMQPGLNLAVAGSQEVGKVVKGVWNSYGEAALLFDVPLQRRNAQGRILAARAELARLLAQERFARDRVQVEVQNALNAMDRAYDLIQRGRDNRLQNTYLEDAEWRTFEAGKSDLFRVNIRELQTVEARLVEIDAAGEFYRALAEYQAALGLDLSRPLGAPQPGPKPK